MSGFSKEGPPLLIEIYQDGRYNVELSSPPTHRERHLEWLFKRHVKKGEFNGLKPGRYQMNYTKLNLFTGYEMEIKALEASERGS